MQEEDQQRMTMKKTRKRKSLLFSSTLVCKLMMQKYKDCFILDSYFVGIPLTIPCRKRQATANISRAGSLQSGTDQTTRYRTIAKMIVFRTVIQPDATDYITSNGLTLDAAPLFSTRQRCFPSSRDHEN